MADSIRSYNPLGFLSGSTLKIFACIFIAFDHVGVIFFPNNDLFRIIGRLAFPLFAYFIAEGCRYTKNKARRLLVMSIIGALYVLFYLVYQKEWYCNIFVTFSISILLIYLLKWFKKLLFEHGKLPLIALSLLAFIAVTAASYFLCEIVYVEYGFKGIMLPVIISLFDFKDVNVPLWLKKVDNHFTGLVCMSFGLLLLCINANLGELQLYSFISVLLLVFYNGGVGCKKLKYMFYIFYPAHLVIIEAISILLSLS
jgi:hypothetical protein